MSQQMSFLKKLHYALEKLFFNNSQYCLKKPAPKPSGPGVFEDYIEKSVVLTSIISGILINLRLSESDIPGYN